MGDCKYRISGLNCSVISKQWHSQGFPCCARVFELPDQQLRDLKFSAKSLEEVMPAEVMSLPKSRALSILTDPRYNLDSLKAISLNLIILECSHSFTSFRGFRCADKLLA